MFQVRCFPSGQLEIVSVSSAGSKDDSEKKDRGQDDRGGSYRKYSTSAATPQLVDLIMPYGRLDAAGGAAPSDREAASPDALSRLLAHLAFNACGNATFPVQKYSLTRSARGRG